jgi:hypothetical protein
MQLSTPELEKTHMSYRNSAVDAWKLVTMR